MIQFQSLQKIVYLRMHYAKGGLEHQGKLSSVGFAAQRITLLNI